MIVVEFTCNNCGQSFNVFDEYLVKKDSVVCPNCSTNFPNESFELLKDGMQKLYDCQKTLPLEDNNLGYCAIMDFKINS